jgi:excisionase family DNA binding protein
VAKQTKPTMRAKNPDPYYTVAEAAEYLNKSKRWVRRQVDERRIRHTHLGRGLAFRRSWLDDFAEAGVVEPEES